MGEVGGAMETTIKDTTVSKIQHRAFSLQGNMTIQRIIDDCGCSKSTKIEDNKLVDVKCLHGSLHIILLSSKRVKKLKKTTLVK